MFLGIVSDTHGHLALTRDAVRMLESLEVEHVLHCGDIGSPDIFRLFEPWPTDFVLGNVDHRPTELQRAVESEDHQLHGRFADLTLAGRRIALLHGDDFRRLEASIHSGDYDLVCSGHTHVAEVRREGSTIALNPGAVYRANPHTIAVVDTLEMAATIVKI